MANAERLWEHKETSQTRELELPFQRIYSMKGNYSLPMDCTFILPEHSSWLELAETPKIGIWEDSLRALVGSAEAIYLPGTVINVIHKGEQTEIEVKDEGAKQLLQLFFETHKNEMLLTHSGKRKLRVGGRPSPEEHIAVTGDVKFFEICDVRFPISV